MPVTGVARRRFLRHVAVGAMAAPAVMLGRYKLFAQSERKYSSRAVRLMQESIVIDLLNHFRFAHQDENPPRRVEWLRDPTTFSPADQAIFRESRIDVFALGQVGDFRSGISPDVVHNAILDLHQQWRRFIANSGGAVLLINTVADFERVHRERKIGIMLTTQNSIHFRTVEDVDTFHALGQRVSQLTYNAPNRLGCGFLADVDTGLTEFGRSIMKRMDEIGMAVDASHCGDRTTLDALDAATKPVLFTHANCRGVVTGHLRAKTDEMIRKMAKTGGVIGINFVRFLVRDREPTTLEHVLDHFDHVRQLVGSEYLAVGGDLDVTGNASTRPATPPPGGGGIQGPNAERYQWRPDPEEARGTGTVLELMHTKRMFDLTDGLIRRGYSDDDIKLILGGNAIRVLGKIWRNPA